MIFLDSRNRQQRMKAFRLRQGAGSHIEVANLPGSGCQRTPSAAEVWPKLHRPSLPFDPFRKTSGHEVAQPLRRKTDRLGEISGAQPRREPAMMQTIARHAAIAVGRSENHVSECEARVQLDGFGLTAWSKPREIIWT